LKFEVGDGNNIHLWFDNWHPAGVLYEKYGFRVVHDSHSKLEARVSMILISWWMSRVVFRWSVLVRKINLSWLFLNLRFFHVLIHGMQLGRSMIQLIGLP
jgi:hypothetical protein